MVKGQRTKGNTKPSSSDRTAQLLASSSSGREAVNTFIGFSTLSSNTTEEEDTTADNDFKMVFKKMSKKDNVTKVKALQEFQQLIRDKPEASVKSILSSWQRIYNKDNDWRVREATHRSQEQLFLKVGKNIAPYLKQMMAIWLTSQYDSYTPAAAAAVSSFETAFPTTKKSDVLVFTKDSILSYIKDMLFNQTIESVSEQTTEPEDKKSKYNRLVSSCLQGLSSLLSSLPTKTLDEIQPNIKELLSNNKFWKFAKFPDTLIRSSWFKLMSTIAQYLPQVFVENANKICGLTLGGLDEKDVLVAASVWECALLSIITIDDCWKNVNFRKAFYPQFRNIVREGGRGNASDIFPNLLPLLSRIPYESGDQFIEFHKEFYTFLREGLQKTASKSQTESNAIIRAFVECLRYSMTNTFITDEDLKNEFQLYLIEKELLSLVREAILSSDVLSKSSLFNDLASLWMYLRKDDKCKELVEVIASQLTDICLDRIKENDFKSFPRISRLFHNLFSDSLVHKKDKKIRFRRDTDEDIEKSVHNLKLNDMTNDEIAVNVLTRISKTLVDNYNSDYHLCDQLVLFFDLIKVQTTDTLKSLLNGLHQDNLAQFLDKFIKEWFRKQSLCLQTDEKSNQTKVLIDLSLLMFGFMESNEEKYRFLNDLLSLNDPYIIELLFRKIISLNDKILNRWIKSESVGNSVVEQTSQLIQKSIDSSNPSSQRDTDVLWKLISLCFADNSFDKLYVESIIDKFRTAIQNNSRSVTNTNFLVDFTCRLASQLFSSYELCTSLTSARELLLTIFAINCRFDDHNKELMNAWKTGVANIVKSNGAYVNDHSIVSRLALHVRNQFQSNITSLENAQMVSKCAFELLTTIYETIPHEEEKPNLLSDPNMQLILDLMFLTNSEWNQLASKCDDCVRHYDWLNGHTLFSAEDCQMIGQSLDTIGVPFVFSAISTSLLIENLLKDCSANELSSEFNQLLRTQTKNALIGCTYLSVKSKSKHWKHFMPLLTVLKQSLTSVLELTKEYTFAENLSDFLLEMSITENGVITQTFGYFIDNFLDSSKEFNTDISTVSLTYSQIITFQKCFTRLSQTRLTQLLADSLNSFVCCERFTQLEDGIAKLAVLQSCLKHVNQSENISETVITLMETLCGLKTANSGLFYYKNDIEADSDLQFYSLIVDIFETIVGKHSPHLSQTHWDLILCSATSWIINIVRQNERLSESLALNIFAAKVLVLIKTISKTFESLPTAEDKDKYPENLSEEWNEFHSKNIFNVLFALYLEFYKKQMNFYEEILFNHISRAVVFVPNSVIIDLLSTFDGKEPLDLEPIDKNYHILLLTQQNQNFLDTFCPLLVNSHLPIALSSHQILLKFIPHLVKECNISPDLSLEEEEILISPPKSLLFVLQQTDKIVDSLLSEFKIGDSCDVEPQTDSFTYAFGYLLVWIEVLEVFANTSDEMHSLFAEFLKQTYLSRLMENLFRLMPTNGTQLSPELFDTRLTQITDFLPIDEPSNCSHIHRLSTHLYYLLLRRMPASVRQWYKNCDKNTSLMVNEFTSSILSPILVSQELDSVQKADTKKFGNFELKVRRSAREVLAIYSIEEMSMELLVRLPHNHPLDPVSVDSGRRVGIEEKLWRKWLLQLFTFLTNQNGSILDGVMLWKRNLDKMFEGKEECMICFYILHGSTLELPEKQCRSCRKRYHSRCLFKWFQTSHNSLCPTCRQLFH